MLLESLASSYVHCLTVYVPILNFLALQFVTLHWRFDGGDAVEVDGSTTWVVG